MSKAVVDPGELRRFALDLKRFNTNLLSQMAVLQSRLNDLGQSWRDQEHKKFAEEFDQQLRGAVRWRDNTEKYIPFLLKKAEKIEEYLNQR